MEKTLYADTLVGENIIITTAGGRDPAMTRLWWTTPRSGGMQSRDGGDYSDVAITGELTQASINSIDGHSRTSVVAVEIGNTVTSIGYCAFDSCAGLTSVTIPASVTSIGYEAFYNCTSLVFLDLSNVDVYTSSLSNAFYGSCIQELWVNESSSNVLSNAPYWGLGIDTSGEKFMMVVYCNDGTVVINGNEGSSSGNSGMTTAICQNGVVKKLDVTGTLSYSHFSPDQDIITSIDIGTNVDSIDGYCFQQMNNLQTVYVPSSVYPGNIWSNAFYGTSMSELYMQHVGINDVLSYASYWGIGFDAYGYPSTVVVYCSDGTIVINGGSAISDGSGSGSN